MTPSSIRKLRLRAGLTVDEAARSVKIKARSWYRYEAGERRIPANVIELFCLKHGLRVAKR